MNTFQFKPLLITIAFAAVIFIIHLTLHLVLGNPDTIESLAMIYGSLLVASLLIVSALIIVRNKNLDNVGYAFMLLTCIKMVVVYFLLKPLISDHGIGLSKVDLVSAFFAMLLIETFVTVRMLNKSE